MSRRSAEPLRGRSPSHPLRRRRRPLSGSPGEKLAAAVFETAPEGIAVFDAETGEILRCNPALARLLGRSREELVGSRVTRHTARAVHEAAARGVGPGEPIRFGHDRFKTIDGRELSIEAEGTFLPFRGRQAVLAFVRDVTDRIRAEAALKESEERHRSIMEAMDDLVYICSGDLRVEYANRAARKRIGRDPVGEQCHYALHGLQRRCPWCVQDAVQEGAHRQYELASSEDGRTYHVSSAPIRHADGRVSTVSMLRDVSDRKQGERALREQKEFSENLVQSCAAAAFVLSPDHRVVFWNRACEHLTGVRAADVVGTMDHWKAFYDRERPCLADLVIDQTPTRAAEYYEVQGRSNLIPEGLHAEGWYRNLGGSDRYILFDAAPIYNSRGELSGVIETLQDVTASKRSEEERSRLATAVAQAVEAIVVTDAQGRIEYVNPAFSRITGYTSAEAVGQTPSLLKSGNHGSEFYRQLWETIGNGGVWRGRITNRTKNGTLYQEESTISPVRDRSGRIINFVAVKRDVTRELHLERQLAQSQKLEALGTLAGGIAHDFNNLLAAIIGYAEMTVDDVPEDSVARLNLVQVLSAADRAKEMVRQILTFSRGGEEDRAPVEIADVIAEALEHCFAALPPGVQLERRIVTRGGTVYANPVQIHQLLLNLCTNAAQAMADGGGLLSVELEEVDVGSEITPEPDLSPGRYARLTVRDTGCGIAPEIIDRIFEPFFTTKDVGEGTGMGLAVVHGIVRAHGGAVQVRSQVGVGTTFSVYLPRVESEAVRGHGDSGPIPGGNETILFVDDEPVLLQLAERMLGQLGYRVVTASSGMKGLEAFRSDPDLYDLVITDQTMADLTGLSLAEKILEGRPEVPIILCTGFGGQVTEERARELGIRELLRKPAAAREFACVIRRVLNESRRSP